LQPWQILIGKAVPALIIGIAEATFIMVVALILFDIPFKGSLAALLFATVVFVISITGVGLFISSLSHTQQQANLGTFTFMVPTMLISGFSTPIENMVSWLQPVSWFMPLPPFPGHLQRNFSQGYAVARGACEHMADGIHRRYHLIGIGMDIQRRLE
jgi:ABC-2 type transport system permease protein